MKIQNLTDLLDVADDDWRSQALCAQVDWEIFFPEQGGSTSEAKRICQLCEVRAKCLEYALANNERYGVFGGMSERERRKEASRRQPDRKPNQGPQIGRLNRDAQIAALASSGASAEWVAEQVDVTADTVRRSRRRMQEAA